MCSLLTSTFFIIIFLLLRLHSLFTFVVSSMCTTGLLTLFAFSTRPSFCVCLSLSYLRTRLGIGCVFFFLLHEISGDDEETEIVYTE